MTYADLLAALKELTPDQLAMDLTIQTADGEFVPGDVALSDEGDDVIGSNHPFIKIDSE